MGPIEPKHTPADVHKLRVQIDSVLKNLQNNFSMDRELALVKTKLQEAKMWAGKELEVLGSELPKEYRDEAPQSPTFKSSGDPK